MGTTLPDGFEMAFPCPKCRRKTKKTVGWIKAHGKYTCVCGTVVNVGTDKLPGDLAKVDQLLANQRKKFTK